MWIVPETLRCTTLYPLFLQRDLGEEKETKVIVWVHVWVLVALSDQVYIGKGTILVDKR